MELRARFDEANNIAWAERLEDAGCTVIYGSEGFKVHSKICQIVIADGEGKERYITQISTGNYNEKTAAMYTDVSLMTANKEIGEDASSFFKNMAIGNLEGEYKHLLVAPVSLKPSILKMIDREIEKGENGRIIMKMNSVRNGKSLNTNGIKSTNKKCNKINVAMEANLEECIEWLDI